MQDRQEARVRTMARRKGYSVRRSRQRTNVPYIDNLGDFRLVDEFHNWVVLGEKYSATLDDIEDYLTS